MPRKFPAVTHALAARHEALWLRLTALHGQIAPIAARRPLGLVSPHSLTIAEGLLREALPFLGTGERLPVAAADHGGLVTQLGQALAQLEHWESRNARWRPDLNAYVWLVAGDEILPVRRLRPKLVMPIAERVDPKREAYIADLRIKLAKRIEQFRNR